MTLRGHKLKPNEGLRKSYLGKMNNEFWENCCSLDFFDYLCTQIRKLKVEN